MKASTPNTDFEDPTILNPYLGVPTMCVLY